MRLHAAFCSRVPVFFVPLFYHEENGVYAIRVLACAAPGSEGASTQTALTKINAVCLGSTPRSARCSTKFSTSSCDVLTFIAP
jgi:hypothetical protein